MLSDFRAGQPDRPLLSVGMSVYNAGKYLRPAVLSVINQTFCDWELLLIDDGSTDGSLDTLAGITDPRIHLIRDGENHGLAARLNQTIDLARGRFFARMDQDDLCHPERFERQLSFLESHPETDLLGTKCITIDEEGRITGQRPLAVEHDEICLRPWAGFYLPHPSWMGKTSWFMEHHYASPGPYFCEDQELLLRTHKQSCFHVLPEALMAYRIHSRIRWGKRFRTRTTLFGIQAAYFLPRREYPAAAMATLAIVLRFIRDLFIAIVPAGRSGSSRQNRYPNDDRFLAYWISALSPGGIRNGENNRRIEPEPPPVAVSTKRFSMFSFWVIGFLYSCLLALVMQKLLLPMMPEMHAGHGLLKNDAIIFHEAAAQLAAKIRANGWSEWVLYPPGFTGNVGVLAALYAFFGPEPAVFIPLNAAAHVTGALMLCLLGSLLWPGKPGRLGGLAAGIVFLAFPSALLWYGQNHKDAFAIAGTLMMLYAWLRLQQPAPVRSRVLRMFLLAGLGIFLLAVVRPYFTTILAAAFAGSWLACLVWTLVRKTLKVRTSSILLTFLFVVLIFAAAFCTSKISSARDVYENPDAYSGANDGASKDVVRWKWNETPGLPKRIDGIFRRVSELRVHFVGYAQSARAGSGIDEHRLPSDAGEVVAYMPRALFVGLFAPFPDSWGQRVSLPRLAAAVETSIWYFFFLGLLVLACRRPSQELLAGLVFSAVILMVLDYANPNIGTLYRLRYGVWMFLLLGGAVGWASLAIDFLIRVERSHLAAHASPENPESVLQRRSSGLSLSALAASGAVTMLITFVGYLGFLVRDLLLVQTNGLNSRTDSLFSAMMLPMVFVNCLAIPISDAITMPFVKLWTQVDPEAGRRFIRKILFWAGLVMGSSAALSFLFAAPAIRLILGGEDALQVSDGSVLLRLFTPIVLLSAWTVVGNAVLNALQRYQDSAMAQLAVPACSITAILLAPPGALPLYAILGMVAGTLANAAIVAILCRRQGITLWPSFRRTPDSHRSMLDTYGWLVFAALFTAATSPVNYYFAGMAGDGGVSGWALSSKMFLLFNGLVVAAVTTVLLPHMARTIVGSTRPQTGSYFVFLLLGGTWAGGLVLLGVAEFAEPMVAALIGRSQVTESQIQVLSQVLRIGMIQLPVLIVGTIIVKAAAVTQRTSRTVLASAVALAVSFGTCGFLVPTMGILGIAYASLGATVAGALYLACTMCKECGMSRLMPWTLLLTWIGWGCVSLAMTTGKGGDIILVMVLLFLMGLLHYFMWHRSLVTAGTSGGPP